MIKYACPECAAGKCVNCAGFSIDEPTDDVVPCPCEEAGHQYPTPARPNRPSVILPPNRPTDVV